MDGSATLQAAIRDADLVAKNGPLAVQLAKRAISEGYQMPNFNDAWNFSLQLYGESFRSHERVEGINAYNEKRRPNFE